MGRSRLGRQDVVERLLARRPHMAVSIPNLYPVRLTPQQRESLSEITRHGRAPARKIRHAQVLILSDHNRPGGKMNRSEIGEAMGMHVNTIDRIRRRFVL